MKKTKLRGAIITFVVLQMCYLFFFFITFPDSFRNAISPHVDIAGLVGAWLSTLTMLGYCVVCLVSVTMLVMHRNGFLLWFQVASFIALAGNFAVYILRQISGDNFFGYYRYRDVDYYWSLLVFALFWLVCWCMYFVRSSRVFSYMEEDDTYLRRALFTKKVKAPAPWAEPGVWYPQYPQYNQHPQYPQYNQYPQYPQQGYPQQGTPPNMRPQPYPAQQPYPPRQQAQPAVQQPQPAQYPGYAPQAYPAPQNAVPAPGGRPPYAPAPGQPAPGPQAPR